MYGGSGRLHAQFHLRSAQERGASLAPDQISQLTN